MPSAGSEALIPCCWAPLCTPKPETVATPTKSHTALRDDVPLGPPLPAAVQPRAQGASNKQLSCSAHPGPQASSSTEPCSPHIPGVWAESAPGLWQEAAARRSRPGQQPGSEGLPRFIRPALAGVLGPSWALRWAGGHRGWRLGLPPRDQDWSAHSHCSPLAALGGSSQPQCPHLDGGSQPSSCPWLGSGQAPVQAHVASTGPSSSWVQPDQAPRPRNLCAHSGPLVHLGRHGTNSQELRPWGLTCPHRFREKGGKRGWGCDFLLCQS